MEKFWSKTLARYRRQYTKLMLASKDSTALSLLGQGMPCVEKQQHSQSSVSPSGGESQPLHKPSVWQRLKRTQRREHKFLNVWNCCSFFTLVKLKPAQPCLQRSTKIPRKAKLWQQLVCVAGQRWRQTAPGKGTGATHGNSNICPPGTKIWGRVSQQMKRTGRAWAAASEWGAFKDVHLSPAVWQPSRVWLLVADLSSNTWFPSLQMDLVFWYPASCSVLRQQTLSKYYFFTCAHFNMFRCEST